MVPENIHTPPTEGICPMTPPPPPLRKFQFSFIHCFKFLALRDPPSSPEFPIPSVGGSMDIFWNHTMSRHHNIIIHTKKEFFFLCHYTILLCPCPVWFTLVTFIILCIWMVNLVITLIICELGLTIPLQVTIKFRTLKTILQW